VFTVFEGRLGAVDERLIAEGRLQQLQSPEQALAAKRDPAAVSGARGGAERIRRDPAVFTRLLCAPVW
jgi:uncharacterized protein